MQIGILIIGDEILSGRRQDKHLAHVIKTLAQRNLAVSWARYVGDDESSLVQNIREIHAGGDLCFSFGGIGATPDDLTRQCVATALNLPLVRHKQAVKEIEAQFGEATYPNRVLMADMPAGARLIPNPVNRVPGFSVDHIHCLPGFPEMAWPMMDKVLENNYPDLCGKKSVQHRLIILDAYESDLLSLMNEVQDKYPTIKLSSLPMLLPDGGRQIEMGIEGTEHESSTAFEYLKASLLNNGLAITDL